MNHQSKLHHLTYIIILLGVVKQHHDLLEKECHSLDKLIANSLARANTVVDFKSTPAFEDYVRQHKKTRKTKREKIHLQQRLLELTRQLNDSLPLIVLQKRTEKLSTKIKQLQDQIDKLTAHNTLPRLAGPVTSNLDSVLHKYKIYPQAYHIRAFIENHCHKYLMAKVYQGICDSVVTKAEELCDHRNVAVRAQAICDKCKDLNRLFSDVHCRILHPNPVSEEGTGEMQGMINICMSFYRREFPEVRVIRKLYMLESQCVPWIQKWGFGLCLHGE